MSETEGKRPSAESNGIAELQAFATLRGRPVVFLFLRESLGLTHLLALESQLGDREFEEVDLVIHSGGGDINTAYQMVELIRLHAQRLFACVPFYAKSAATLLCLGADEIFLDKLAELGPLDTQVYEEKKGGKGDFVSALNPFKTLEQLQAHSLEALDRCVRMLVARSSLDVDECIRHAIRFSVGTTSPLFAKLNPEKLGEYSRALAVGSEYGARLLRRFSAWDGDKRSRVVEKLVHGYPSHDYIIDYHELDELGFTVKLFEDAERTAIRTASLAVLQPVEGNEQAESLIALAEPTKPTRKTRTRAPEEVA